MEPAEGTPIQSTSTPPPLPPRRRKPETEIVPLPAPSRLGWITGLTKNISTNLQNSASGVYSLGSSLIWSKAPETPENQTSQYLFRQKILQNNLMDIPEIFCHLTFLDLYRCSQVNKKWNQLSRPPLACTAEANAQVKSLPFGETSLQLICKDILPTIFTDLELIDLSRCFRVSKGWKKFSELFFDKALIRSPLTNDEALKRRYSKVLKEISPPLRIPPTPQGFFSKVYYSTVANWQDDFRQVVDFIKKNGEALTSEDKAICGQPTTFDILSHKIKNDRDSLRGIIAATLEIENWIPEVFKDKDSFMTIIECLPLRSTFIIEMMMHKIKGTEFKNDRQVVLFFLNSLGHDKVFFTFYHDQLSNPDFALWVYTAQPEMTISYIKEHNLEISSEFWFKGVHKFHDQIHDLYKFCRLFEEYGLENWKLDPSKDKDFFTKLLFMHDDGWHSGFLKKMMYKLEGTTLKEDSKICCWLLKELWGRHQNVEVLDFYKEMLGTSSDFALAAYQANPEKFPLYLKYHEEKGIKIPLDFWLKAIEMSKNLKVVNILCNHLWELDPKLFNKNEEIIEKKRNFLYQNGFLT